MSNFSGDRENNGTLSEDKFRIPVPIPPANTDSTSVPNWLHQSTFLDGNSGGQHFSSWERTTHFRTQGSSSLITTVQQQTTVNGGVTKPVIKPIPSRLGSPLTMIKYEPKHYPELLTPTFMNSSIKFESSPVTKFDDDAVDSAFEDDSGCSRTTPVNHKSLRKWRQHSQPSGGKGRSSFQPISIHTSSPFEESVIGGPLSAPSILHHWTNNRPGSSGGGSAGSSSNGSFAFSPRDSLYASPTGLSFRDSFESSSRLHSKSETITSPEHLDVSDEGGHGNTVNQALSIPVGIAVARQRERESSPMVKSDIELMIPPAPGKLSLDSYSRPPPAHHQPQPIPSWPPLPFAADAFAHQSALAASLPLGYQLAKDPLTGQVFFVPGAAFATAFTHTQLLWPPPGASMPPPPPPPPLSTSPFHQSLLQLQQETWMARHQFLYGSSLSQLSAVAAAAANVPTPPPAHQRSSEPLTTLRVPTSAAVASLIAENGHIRRPPRTFKQETQDGDVKQNSNFLVGSFNNSSSLADSAIGINSINSECSDDRISVGSFSDEVKFTPPIVTVTTPEDDDIADHLTIENVKTERKDSFDQEQSDQNHNHDEPVKSGLDLLTEGIERLEKLSENGNDKRPRLSSTPPRGGRQMSVDVPRSSGGLRLLCDAALMSKDVDEDRSSPKVRSKSLDSHMQSTPKAKYDLIARNYSSPRAEQNAKAFIASKSVKVGDLLGVELGTGNNSDLGTWEKNVRLNIANIQRQYKEKYKELYKLQHQTTKKSSKGRRSSSESSPPKKMAKTDSHSPGRERESSLWVPKPKHTHIKTENNHHHKRQTENNTSDNVQWEIKRDLSDITSKFKSSRPNPFENLLRLATSKSSPKPEPIYSSTPKIHKPVTLVGNVTPICASPPSTENSTVDVTNNTEKSRHSSPPRKTFGISVSNSHNITIKAKEDRNAEEKGIINSNKLEEIEDLKSCQSKKVISSPVLEPMTELKGPSITFKISKKEPIQEEIEDDVMHIKTKKNKKYKKNKKDKKRDRKEKKERRMKVVVDDEESCDTILDREIKSQIHKKKKNKKSRETLGQDPSSCVIQESDLTEGLRVLIKLEGHFYPGKIQAISPPDIYGVLVDRERGNKPHIFSREEVLQDAVFEVRPASSEDLTSGTRVCAYWSQKYHHLYPGTVSDTVRSDPKLDSNFVNIELDDGDSRDIHIDNIRYLPPEYPLVEYDPDPMASLTKRKRRHSFESTTSEGSRATKTPRLSVDEQHGSCIVRFPAPPPGCQRSLWSSQDMSEPTSPPSKQLKLRVNITHAKREGSKDKGSGAEKSSGMAAFLHPQQLWRWSSSGDRRPRSRRITHQEIEREEDEVLSVGDCAVFLSTGRPDRPYVGKIEALWESAGGHMRVKVRWFYHAVETEGGANGGRRVDELNLPGALFQSNHFDENDVQTISHRCEVLSYKAYKRIMDADPQRLETVYENNDLYYLAGEYDPIVGIIQFEKGVLESK